MTDERPRLAAAVFAAVVGGVVALAALLVRSRTLLPPAFFDAVAFASIAWGASLFAHRHLGAPVAPVLRAVGLAGAALLFLGVLVPPFDRAALPLALWALASGLLQASVRAKKAAAVPAAVGTLVLILGASVAWLAASSWPEAARLRATIAAATALSLAGLGARLFLARRHPNAAPMPLGILLGATLGATYVGYRPLVAASVANLPLYEWTLGVAVAVLLLGRLRRSARDSAVPEAWSGDARRHTAAADPAYDIRMAPLAAAISRYLETGTGFEEYRTALARAAPGAAPSFRKALQGARPVPGKGRGGRSARAERLATHERLMETLHGDATTPPPVRTHP